MNYSKGLAFVLALLKLLVPWINETKWQKAGSVMVLAIAMGAFLQGVWVNQGPATQETPLADRPLETLMLTPVEVVSPDPDVLPVEGLDVLPDLSNSFRLAP